MSQTHTVGKHATKITQDGQEIRVRYQSTDVVTVTPHQILLDTGGWFTQTTKTRMNQASNQFRLGYHIFQKAGEWYAEYKGQTLSFDGHNSLVLDI